MVVLQLMLLHYDKYTYIISLPTPSFLQTTFFKKKYKNNLKLLKKVNKYYASFFLLPEKQMLCYQIKITIQHNQF